jgi:hypothetical protein
MPSNGYASRDDFWKFSAREYKEVEFPGIGRVTIQSLSDGEQRAVASKGRDEFGRLTDASNLFAHRAIAQIVDPETKQPMFGDIDLPKLSAMRYSATRPIMEAMLDFAMGTETEPDDPEEAEDALKKTS